MKKSISIVAVILFSNFNLTFAETKKAAEKTRKPAQSVEVVNGFKNFCASCHVQYGDITKVQANSEAIYLRLKWIKDGDGQQAIPADMPKLAPLQEFLKPENKTLRVKMMEFVKPTGTAIANMYPIEKLKAPPGFTVSLWAKVPGARSMALAPDGTLFVGTGGFSNPQKKVYRIKDWNNNGLIEASEIQTFINNLNNPNGVALRQGSLYVAEVNRVIEFKNVLTLPKTATLTIDQGKVLPQQFPSDAHHGWKFIRFAPPPNDNWLYVPVGAPCNICKVDKPYATIHRIDVTNDKIEPIVLGIRSVVGFDFHPVTKNLWFTENGRDSMGDDIPPDELNEVTQAGEHFGFPFCHGKEIKDPDIAFNQTIQNCAQTKAPAVLLPAHSASLGMRFYLGNKFPAEFKNQTIIAEHGSWNRSKKSGYRVSMVTKENNTLVYKPFVEGWLDQQSQKHWGRPVDIEEMPDGSILISDDGIPGSPFLGAIYKVQYTP